MGNYMLPVPELVIYTKKWNYQKYCVSTSIGKLNILETCIFFFFLHLNKLGHNNAWPGTASIYLHIYIYIYIYIYIERERERDRSVSSFLFIDLSLFISTYLSFFPSIYFVFFCCCCCFFISISICLLSIYLSIYLSTRIYIHMCIHTCVLKVLCLIKKKRGRKRHHF